MANNEKATVN